MTWIKLQDNAPRHPKVGGLSDKSFRVWINSLCYSSEFLTDGVVPAVFLVGVKESTKRELLAAGLWRVMNGIVQIHEYLDHQTSRADVDRERARNRARRGGTAGTAAGTPGGGTGEKPPPENREQRTDTENREQKTATPSMRGVSLVMNGAQFERLQHANAFVGPMLRVPNALHAELLAKSGNRDAELRVWYAALDAELEQSGKGTGDVFAWLRPRHQAFALAQGWIDAPPVVTAKPSAEPFSIEKALAIEAQRKAERMAKGATR
ncbi:MAG: hypothetical protein RL409_2653 [Gemmatimonadota bacterium]|jgi:hypothetical protein